MANVQQIVLAILLVAAAELVSRSQAVPSAQIQMLGRWCCLNLAEYAKCREWTLALNQTSSTTNPVLLECVLATDKYDCFKKIFEDKADLMTADAGEVYIAGKYYNLLPIATESYYGGPSQPTYTETYAVAVVKRGSGMSISNLQGSNSCHDGVGTSSGWNIPISTLIEKKLLEIVDCNNHVKAATRFFNKMCAPDALNAQFNPTGDNPTSACELCRGRIGSTFCTNQDPYAGSIGAMYCLIDGGGDVAFVKHTTLNELVALNKSINLNDFELLCPNVIGSPYMTQGPNVSVSQYPTAPLNQFMSCNWGVVPPRAILTSSRKALVQRRSYRAFLAESAARFGAQSPFNAFPQATIYQTTTLSMMFNGSANVPPYGMNPDTMNNPGMMSPLGGGGGGPASGSGGIDWNQMNQMSPQSITNQQNYFNGGGVAAGNMMTGHDQFSQMNTNPGGMLMMNNPGGMMNYSLQQASSAPFDITNLFDNPLIYNNFKLFDSATFNGRDLLFLDQTVSFMDLDDKTSYLTFLTENYRNKILKLYECPLRLVRWCVISDFEKDKCRIMRNAFASRNVKPDLDCVSASSAWECMSMIKNRLADLITLDPADAYRASRYFGLVPLAAEDYGTIDPDTERPIFYVVAVVKRTDLVTNLWNLRTRKACGSAFGDMAGYHVPVNYLIQIKELYVTDCNVPKVAGEYLGRCCMPGALDYNYNTLKTNPRALCLRCYSKGADYCSRSHREYFYGDTGAFRCINEGNGDVAFVKHTSVQSNTDGRNTDQWAYGLRQTDYELLCKDGTRRSTEKYDECNLMKVPSRVVMVGGFRTDIQRSYLWNMLNFAQQLFGSDTNPDFSLFESFKEHPDLIFSDSCMQLFQIDTDIETFLGPEVIEIIHKTDPRICNRAEQLNLSSLSLTLTLALSALASHFYY